MTVPLIGWTFPNLDGPRWVLTTHMTQSFIVTCASSRLTLFIEVLISFHSFSLPAGSCLEQQPSELPLHAPTWKHPFSFSCGHKLDHVILTLTIRGSGWKKKLRCVQWSRLRSCARRELLLLIWRIATSPKSQRLAQDLLLTEEIILSLSARSAITPVMLVWTECASVPL